MSLDAKAPVLIGPFSRGGSSRLGTKGADHDFHPWGKLTPFGIFLPDHKDLSLYFTGLQACHRTRWFCDWNGALVRQATRPSWGSLGA